MTPRRTDNRLMTVAIVLIGIAVLLGPGLNRLSIQEQFAQRAHDQKVLVAQAKAQSDAQIAAAKVQAAALVAQAKTLAAEQVAVAKAEVQRQLCELITILQPSPVSRSFAEKEGCVPTPVSPRPGATGGAAPTSTAGAVAAPTPSVRVGAVPRAAGPAAEPTRTPLPSPTPTRCALNAFAICL